MGQLEQEHALLIEHWLNNCVAHCRRKGQLKILRHTYTAENRSTNRPSNSVTANPRIAPGPNAYRNSDETIVVTCVSMIVMKVAPNPWTIAEGIVFPERISSRIR